MRRLGRWILNGLVVLLSALGAGMVLFWAVNCHWPRARLVISRPTWAAFVASDVRTLRLWTQELRPAPPVGLAVPIDKPYSNGVSAASGVWGFQNYSWSTATAARAEQFGFNFDAGNLSAHIGRNYYNFVVVKHQLLLPWWPILVVAVVLSGLAARRILFSRQARSGHCNLCGYDLTGNVSGVCPECGTKVAKAT